MKRRYKELKYVLVILIVVSIIVSIIFIAWLYSPNNVDEIFVDEIFSVDQSFIENGDFETGSLTGWGYSSFGHKSNFGEVNVARVKPHSGNYSARLILAGDTKTVKLEPIIPEKAVSKIKRFDFWYRLVNKNGTNLVVTLLIKKDVPDLDYRSMTYILNNKGSEYKYYNETSQIAFEIQNADVEWKEFSRNIADDFKNYWDRDNIDDFILKKISIEMHVDEEFRGPDDLYVYFDDFNMLIVG